MHIVSFGSLRYTNLNGLRGWGMYLVHYILVHGLPLHECLMVYLKAGGRGPGINSSQSKNVGEILLSMQLAELGNIFDKKRFSCCQKNLIFGMEVDTLFGNTHFIFQGWKKIINWVFQQWSSEAAQNFEFHLSDWHCRRRLSMFCLHRKWL